MGVRRERIVNYVEERRGEERRGEHQSYFIETFREVETKLVGYEIRVSFEENHKFQPDTKIKKKIM